MIALFLSGSMFVAPSSQPELLSEAESEYRAGLELRDDSAKARPHFIRAAEIYEQLWNSGQHSPAIAQSMAQARLLAGDPGRAIRDYRRGLRVAPHDPDLRRGLDVARERVAFPQTGDVASVARARDVGSRFDRLGISLPRLAIAALVFSAIGWFTLARAWIVCRGGLAVFGGAIILISLAFGAWLWWEDERLRAHWAEPTAVAVSPVELRTGNSTEYSQRVEGRLPAGVEMRVLGERGGWLHVELADGTAGWVPANRVVVVE